MISDIKFSFLELYLAEILAQMYQIFYKDFQCSIKWKTGDPENNLLRGDWLSPSQKICHIMQFWTTIKKNTIYLYGLSLEEE